MERGKDRIRTNCICPGSVGTEMVNGPIKNFAKKMSDQSGALLSDQIIAKGIPLGRIGEPHDVANLALFLSSDASNVNGSVVVINGGQSL
jgi:3alpha(or 20beta)-hydroxysteroid dehydrogenase